MTVRVDTVSTNALLAPEEPFEPTSIHPRGSYRPDVQGLRAVAVVLVILVHASVPGFEGGYVGVDVFFVISGYVITGLLLRQGERGVARNLGQFYARRIRRIVPAATLALVATLVAAQVLLGANFPVSLLGDVRYATLFAANVRFIHTGANYFVPGLAPSLVTHYWSLAVEEQFYLFYPLVVFTIARVAPARHRHAALAATLAVLVGCSGWWSYHLTALSPAAAFYSPFTRFWEFALGGLVAVVPPAWMSRRALNTVAAVAAVLVLALSVARLNAHSAVPGVLVWWPCAASAVLLVTGRASLRGAPASWLSWRPLRYLGDISYSLYLWHYVWLMLPLEFAHPNSSAGARLVEVAGAVACAVVSYHLLENPLRRSRALARDAWANLLVLLICVALSWDATLVIGRVVHAT